METGAEHRASRWAPGRGTGVVALALACWLTGCALQPSMTATGGLAPADADRLSLAVAQARAQFPDLSAPGLRYTVHGSKAPQSAPALALQGQGEGFSRGLQLSSRSKGTLKLYLDKTTYASGYAEVQVDAGPVETWPIVAYELRGQPTDRFEFTYLLAPPAGGLRYFVLLGGTYGDAKEQSLAYEGILFVPAPGKGLDDWARAFKFNFGFTYPATPAYQAQVDEAEALFSDLQRDASALESLAERAKRSDGELAAAQTATDPGHTRRGPDPATLQGRARDAKGQLQQRAEETQVRLLQYYAVRRALDTAYADFVKSNPYTWRDKAGQIAFYKRWQTVEFHHPRIDELVKRLLPLLPDAKQVETARAEAMAQFARTNNWDKNPERAAPADPTAPAIPNAPSAHGAM